MKRVVLAATILALASAVAQAQIVSVPQLINYQGRLTDINGVPLSTGNYRLDFSVYGVATGGSPEWGPLIFDGGTTTGHGALVPVVNGHFNVFLGPVDTGDRSIADAFRGPARYLGIKINNGPEVVPRQQILASPFAIQAERIDDKDITDILTKEDYDADRDHRVGAADHATQADDSNTIGGQPLSNILTKTFYDTNTDNRVNAADHATQATNSDAIGGQPLSNLLTKSSYDTNSDNRVNAADHATNATNATNAGHATTADVATRGVPIGTILAWHKSWSGTPALPTGWVECSGQFLVLPGSPYHGRNMPNLNGGTTSISGDASRGRFLRGHTSSGGTQGDQSNRLDAVHTNASDNAPLGYWVGLPENGGQVRTSTWYESSRDSMYFRLKGRETRVANFSVVWIMRVL